MKRLIALFFTVMMALPSLAHAQNIHASFFNGGTTLTATCTNTTGTLASSDVFLGTAQGNTTVTLPASAIGCVDYDVIDLRFTAAASQTYTLTVNGGTGTVTKVPSNGGNIFAAPAGLASGGVQGLHQIWVYNAVATTPQWELVTQELIPAAGMAIGACPAGGDAATAPYLCANGNTVELSSAQNTQIRNFGQIDAFFGFSTIIMPSGAGGGITSVDISQGATLQSSLNSGVLPTVTGGCGSGNVNAGSTNNRGSVTTGTAETTCTVVFSASGVWGQAPFCLCGDGGGDATPLGCSVSSQTTAHFIMTFAAATAKTFNYMCF